ncbi:MAG: hypothetical protein NTU83_07920, partial [Candidatus Hydrogenedentes bacterium]|nr:hypothetical protein [Candidatus Hydrogenedentota bacterium]
MAVQHNHTYQAQKESVYLNALGLTLDRHKYTPIFSASGQTGYTHSTKDVTRSSTLKQAFIDAPEMMQRIDKMTGAPADLLKSYADLVTQAPGIAGLKAARTVVVDDNSISAKG